MPIQAQGPDGNIHEFPDGTPDAVVDRVMRGVITGAAQPAQQEAQPEQSFGDKIVKGLDRLPNLVGLGNVSTGLTKADVSPAEAAGRLTGGAANSVYAASRGTLRALTGDLGNRAIGGIASLTTRQGEDPTALAQEDKAAAQQLSDTHPGSNIVGEGVGGLGLAKALGGVGVKGVMAQGGIASGLGTFAQTGDPVKAAIAVPVGMVTGKAAEGLTDLAGQAVSGVKNFVTGAAAGDIGKVISDIVPAWKNTVDSLATKDIPKSIRIIANKAGVTPQEVVATKQAMQTERGGPVSYAEAADPKAVEKYRALTNDRGAVSAVASDAADASDATLPENMRQRIAGQGPTATADEVAAREQAAGDTQAAARESDTVAQQQQLKARAQQDLTSNTHQTAAQIQAAKDAAEEARAGIAHELDNATETGDIHAPERAQNILDEWANKAYDAAPPVTFGEASQVKMLQNDNVLNILNRQYDAIKNLTDPASVAEAKNLDTIISNIRGGKGVMLPGREVDLVRKGLRTIANNPSKPNPGLNRLADAIEDHARKAPGGVYNDILNQYAAGAQAIEGHAQGAGVLAGKGQTAFQQAAADATSAKARGIDEGARVAIKDAATADPEGTARAISNDPGNVQAAVAGQRSQRIIEASVRGAKTIDQALQAAKDAGLRGRAMAAAIKDAWRTRNAELGRQGAAAVADAKGVAATRVGVANRAGNVLSDDITEYQQAVNNAPADMRGDISAIARGKVADTAGRDAASAKRTADALQTTSFQQKYGTATSPEEAARLGSYGATEANAAKNLDRINVASGRQEDPLSWVKIGANAARAVKTGIGFPELVKQGFAKFRSAGLSDQHAKAMAMTLFSKDPAVRDATEKQMERLGIARDFRDLIAKHAGLLAASTLPPTAADGIQRALTQ